MVQFIEEGQHAALIPKKVDFVDDDNHGALFLAQGIDDGGKIFFEILRMQDIGMRIEHRHDDIGLTETFPDSLHHGLAEISAPLRKSGSIHKNGLHAGLSQNADDFIARRLRLRGDNRYFLPHEGIEESGFAGVRRPHEGNPAASVIGIAHDKNSFGSGTRRQGRSVQKNCIDCLLSFLLSIISGLCRQQNSGRRNVPIPQQLSPLRPDTMPQLRTGTRHRFLPE